MIQINGRKGGGQILRTALTISAIKGIDFRMENIRGSRTTPGIQKQHLECVKAVKRLTSAETEGMELGSEELLFKPGKLENKGFTVNIGTAGSVNLVLDTVLPITSQFNNDFRLELKGGTDVKWAPPSITYRNVKMPLLKRFGVKADYEVEKTGFYPSGNGKLRLETQPHSLERIDITERGELEKFEIYSKASRELESRNVAERQADEAERMIKNSHISKQVKKNLEYVETSSTGSVMTLKAVYENSVVGFDTMGEKGKRSEDVAEETVKQFKKFHSSEAAVDPRMADQLMVYMAVTGGRITTSKLTNHIQTNIEVLRSFGSSIELNESKTTSLIFNT